MKEKIEQYVDKQFKIRVGTMLVLVRCLDYKVSYGKERWLVAPEGGTGTMWVQEILPMDALNND